MKTLLIFLISASSFASGIQGKSIIQNEAINETKESVRVVKSSAEVKANVVPKKVFIKSDSVSNLPGEYRNPLTVFNVDQKSLFVSRNPAKLNGMKSGTIFRAVIDQELIISQNVPNPVRAVITTGDLAGNYVLGDAIFDKDLKRALITFTKILLKDQNETLSFKGQALNMRGSVGLEGEYFNQSAKFIVAEFASAAVAASLDSGISRSQTIQGNYVTEPSATNAAKSGAVAALSKSTDKFAEAARSTSDYIKTNPHTEIQVVINEDASLNQ